MASKLTINPNLEKQITEMLSNEGLSPDDIQTILKGDYQGFLSEEDINAKLPSIFKTDEYTSIIQGIADGYTLDEMPQELGISLDKINAFKNTLVQNHLSLEEVKAFNKYTVGSNMILGAKRGIPKEQILESITSDFDSRMTEYGFTEEQISQIGNHIKGLDYSLPLHQNYQLTREFLQQYGLSNKYIATVQSSVKNLDSYYHLDETLASLDKGLKTNLPESMELFRAVKSSFLEKGLKQGEDLTSLIGKRIEENGYSSTSPLYDTSFAKYDDYDVVFDIYAPKGTQGTQVTPFSSYGTAEQEVLLNSNDLFITDVIPNVTDKNGRTKTVCKSLMLSKDKSCYKGIGKQQNFQQATNIEEMSKDQLSQLRDQIKEVQQMGQDVNDKQFLDYRQKINSILESSPSDEYVHSSFSVYKTQEQQERCRHTLETVMEGQEKKTLLEQDFEYTEHFKKGMLEPSIVDFSRRNPISSTNLAPTPNQTPEQIAQGTKSDVHLFGETNNMLSVNNVDTSFAVQISQQAPQINPDIFMQQQAQLQQMQMTQGGPTLSLTMGGFINVLVLSSLVSIVCFIVFFITLYLIS